jgi:hypothetical protein
MNHFFIQKVLQFSSGAYWYLTTYGLENNEEWLVYFEETSLPFTEQQVQKNPSQTGLYKGRGQCVQTEE